MTHAFGAKPPAIAWFGQFFVPLRHALGGYSAALLLSVVVCQALTVWLLFLALERLGGRRAGIVGALGLGSAPLFIAMSHQYFAEPIQTVSTGWILLILASAAAWRPALVVAQIPGAIALGLLSKLSAPLYMVAPTAGAVLLAFRFRKRVFEGKAHRDVAVVVSTGISTVLSIGAASWYSVNLHTAIDHARAASANNGLYGVNRGFAIQFKRWLSHLRDVSFLPHLGLITIALAVVALIVAAKETQRLAILDSRVIVGLASAISIVLVLATFASQPNEDLRYLLPVIPYTAMLLGLAATAPRTSLFSTAIAAVFGIQFASGTLQSFATSHPSSMISPLIDAPTQKTAFARNLDAIVDQTCTPSSSDKINMVGVEYPWLNENTLEMLAAERFAESGRYCYYTTLGYATTSPNAAWRRVIQFMPPFYISLDYGSVRNRLPATIQQTIDPTDPFNVTNVAVFRRAVASTRFSILPGSRQAGTIILVARPSP
jgi:hypothetical protein